MFLRNTTLRVRTRSQDLSTGLMGCEGQGPTEVREEQLFCHPRGAQTISERFLLFLFPELYLAPGGSQVEVIIQDEPLVGSPCFGSRQ